MEINNIQDSIVANYHIKLLVDALERAKHNDGVWLNPEYRQYIPNIYGDRKPSIVWRGDLMQPFFLDNGLNIVLAGLHAYENNCKGAVYETYERLVNAPVVNPYTGEKSIGYVLDKGATKLPLHYYECEEYAAIDNDEYVITKERYEQLSKEEKNEFEPVPIKKTLVLYNVEQVSTQFARQNSSLEELKDVLLDDDMINREYLQADENVYNGYNVDLTNLLKDIEKYFEVRISHTNLFTTFDVKTQSFTIPSDGKLQQYDGKPIMEQMLQEAVRAVVASTGINTLAYREGLYVSKDSKHYDDAIKYERLVNELATGAILQYYRVPGVFAKDSMDMIDYWQRELQENPDYMSHLEKDVNKAVSLWSIIDSGRYYETNGLDIPTVPTVALPFHHALGVDEDNVTEGWSIGTGISSADLAIMQDIIRKGGMDIDVRNFGSEEKKQQWIKAWQFSRLEEAKSSSILYPDMKKYAQQIVEDLTYCHHPSEWESFDTVEDTHETEKVIRSLLADERRIVVVADENTGIYDVVMPKGAYSGGKVQMPNGDEISFSVSPDEVMSESERKKSGATIIKNEETGFNKERITKSLEERGAKYVRFFNESGKLSYMPNDKYFEGKRVTEERLVGWKLVVKGDVAAINQTNKEIRSEKKEVREGRKQAEGVVDVLAVADYQDVRKLAHGIKDGDLESLEISSRIFTRVINTLGNKDNFIIVPMPSHTGNKDYPVSSLAQSVSEQTGIPFVPLLGGGGLNGRSESVYDFKKAHPNEAIPLTNIYMEDEYIKQSVGKTPIIIDNVLDTGHTAYAAFKACDEKPLFVVLGTTGNNSVEGHKFHVDKIENGMNIVNKAIKAKEEPNPEVEVHEDLRLSELPKVDEGILYRLCNPSYSEKTQGLINKEYDLSVKIQSLNNDIDEKEKARRRKKSDKEELSTLKKQVSQLIDECDAVEDEMTAAVEAEEESFRAQQKELLNGMDDTTLLLYRDRLSKVIDEEIRMDGNPDHADNAYNVIEDILDKRGVEYDREELTDSQMKLFDKLSRYSTTEESSEEEEEHRGFHR